MDQEQTTNAIEFDAVYIDLAGRRLFVAGKKVALEPKVFDVLAMLVRSPGRAFTREEILDSVWGHRHVTSGVLNRAVALIRQALKVDELDRQYLQTLHGKGYRFDVPAALISKHRSFPDADLESARDGPEDRRNVEMITTASGNLEVLQGTSPPPMDPLVELDRPRTLSRRSAAVWLCLVLVAICAVIPVSWHRGWGHGAKDGSLGASPILVVLPLHAVDGDQDESNFADGLSEELITRLAHIEGLQLISSTSAARAKRDGFDAEQLSRNLHVTHALEGSLRHEADQLRIDLRLIATPSGRTLWAQSYDRKLADVFALQQEIAQGVASTLALHVGLSAANKGTVDPQVLRKYLELRHIFNVQLDDTDQAEEDLHALAARTPNFAPIHGLLALNLASDFEPHTDADVVAEATHALNLDPDTIYAHAALGELACRRMDWVACMAELRTAISLNPTDSIIRLVYGMWCANLGYRDEALLQFETAYAVDPLNYWTNFQRGTELDVLGRHDEARQYLDALSGLDPKSDEYTTAARWRNDVLHRDFVSARAMVHLLPNTQHLQDAHAAVTDALQDGTRWPDADSAIAQRENEVGGHIWLRLFQPEPDIAAILELFESSLRDRDLTGRYVWATNLAALRNYPAFSEMLHRTHIVDYWQINGWPPQCALVNAQVHCD